MQERERRERDRARGGFNGPPYGGGGGNDFDRRRKVRVLFFSPIFQTVHHTFSLGSFLLFFWFFSRAARERRHITTPRGFTSLSLHHTPGSGFVKFTTSSSRPPSPGSPSNPPPPATPTPFIHPRAALTLSLYLSPAPEHTHDLFVSRSSTSSSSTADSSSAPPNQTHTPKKIKTHHIAPQQNTG